MSQIRENGGEIQYPNYRWFVCATMFISIIAEGMLLVAPSPIVQPISESIGLSLGQTSAMMIVSFTFCVAIFGVVGGVIADKIGLPVLYVVCMSLKIIGSILFLTGGTTVPLLLLGRLLCGIASGPIIATGAKLAGDWFPVSQRGTVLGLNGGALGLGIMLGVNVSPQVFAATGNWNQAVAAAGIVSIPALIMSIIFLNGQKPPAVNMTGAEGSQEDMSLFKAAVTQPVFYAGILGAFCVSWVQQAYGNLTPGMLAIEAPVGLGYSAIFAGQIMGLYNLTFMVGSFLCGIIMHAVFKDKARVFIPFAFLLAAVFSLSILVPGIGGNKAALSLCLLIAGFFTGIPQASIQAFIAINYPRSIVGKIGGITLGLGILGGTIGIAAGSIVLHMTETYRLPVAVASLAAVVGSIATLLLKKPAVFENKAS